MEPESLPATVPPDAMGSPTLKPRSFSLPLPLAPQTSLHIQLTHFRTSTLLFLTTRTPAGPSSTSPLGSFICALPNRSASSSRAEPVLSTPLIEVPGSQEFATRVARAVAKRMGKPAYVGCSVEMVAGATVEEETEQLKAAVGAVLKVLEEGEGGGREVNGEP